MPSNECERVFVGIAFGIFFFDKSGKEARVAKRIANSNEDQLTAVSSALTTIPKQLFPLIIHAEVRLRSEKVFPHKFRRSSLHLIELKRRRRRRKLPIVSDHKFSFVLYFKNLHLLFMHVLVRCNSQWTPIVSSVRSLSLSLSSMCWRNYDEQSIQQNESFHFVLRRRYWRCLSSIEFVLAE